MMGLANCTVTYLLRSLLQFTLVSSSLMLYEVGLTLYVRCAYHIVLRKDTLSIVNVCTFVILVEVKFKSIPRTK